MDQLVEQADLSLWYPLWDFVHSFAKWAQMTLTVRQRAEEDETVPAHGDYGSHRFTQTGYFLQTSNVMNFFRYALNADC